MEGSSSERIISERSSNGRIISERNSSGRNISRRTEIVEGSSVEGQIVEGSSAEGAAIEGAAVRDHQYKEQKLKDRQLKSHQGKEQQWVNLESFHFSLEFVSFFISVFAIFFLDLSSLSPIRTRKDKDPTKQTSDKENLGQSRGSVKARRMQCETQVTMRNTGDTAKHR